MISDVFHAIVVGAGPAGLSASLLLARYRRRVLTFHNNSPRNLYSHGIHAFLGHDGILPSDLLERGREEVVRYGGQIVECCVRTVGRRLGSFRISDGEREYRAETILLATGLKDVLPDCPGFREFYGKSVHHCPDCDGYEARDRHIAVIGKGVSLAGFARNFLTWTDRITAIADGCEPQPSREEVQEMRELGMDVLCEEVARLSGDAGTGQVRTIHFRSGRTLDCDALFFNYGTHPANDLHLQLGCALDPATGLVAVDKHQQTSVPGVYAAGDLTPHSQLAVVAAAEGAMAAIHIHKLLGVSVNEAFSGH